MSCAYLKARYRVRLPNKACKAIRSPADLVVGSRLGQVTMKISFFKELYDFMLLPKF